MRTAILVSTFAALAASQSIEFSLVDAAPVVSITAAPFTGTAQTVSVQPSAAATSIESAAVQASPIAQRDGTCAQQPDGTGPTVNQ